MLVYSIIKCLSYIIQADERKSQNNEDNGGILSMSF